MVYFGRNFVYIRVQVTSVGRIIQRVVVTIKITCHGFGAVKSGMTAQGDTKPRVSYNAAQVEDCGGTRHKKNR